MCVQIDSYDSVWITQCEITTYEMKNFCLWKAGMFQKLGMKTLFQKRLGASRKESVPKTYFYPHRRWT